MPYSADSKPLAVAGPAGGPPRVQDQDATVTAARDLLARTAELPGSRRELLAVLGEYRRMLVAMAVTDGT